MAVICCTLIATFLVYFSSFSSPVKGELEIVPPFPGQPVVIEEEKVRIPCAAQDLENVTKPHNITFYKVINRYGDLSVPLSTNENFAFETKFYMNGWRIMSYLVIHNMTEALKGRYECHAARPQDNNGRVVPAKYGFSIVYIPKAALPSLNHSKNVTTEFGKPASLYCQVVPAKVQVSTNLVKLDKIAWYRNNLPTNRELTALQDKLPNINLTMTSSADGGTYTCSLDTTLGLSRQYNITGILEVRIQLKIDNGTTSVKGVESRDVVMECPADAYPLNVTWMRVNKEGQRQQLESNERYLVTRPCESCRYRMTIKNLQPRDFGNYICVATSNMESGIHHFKLGPEENPTTGSSAERNKFHFFLVLITGVVTWLLCKKTL